MAKPPRSPGRPRGLANLAARTRYANQMVEDLWRAYTELGGYTWLTQLADKEPKVYAQMLVKALVPKSVDVQVDVKHSLEGILAGANSAAPIEAEVVSDTPADQGSDKPALEAGKEPEAATAPEPEPEPAPKPDPGASARAALIKRRLALRRGNKGSK